MSGDNGWDALIAACERGWRRLSDEGFLYISDTALMSCPQCAALVALRDCDRHDDWHVYGPPTLPPPPRRDGGPADADRVTAYIAQARRLLHTGEGSEVEE